MTSSKNIAIFHYQVGNTDGVSLEIEKWQTALENLGHRVTLCAGDLGVRDGCLIPEMYHHLSEIELIDRNSFRKLTDFSVSELWDEISDRARSLEIKFEDFIRSNQIDLLLPNNLWSVAMNLPAAVALENVRRKLALPAIAHHHDFYWERKGDINLTCYPVMEIADRYLPPHKPDIRHVVINSLAKDELYERKGVDALIVPNVMDFDSTEGQLDEYNRDLRDSIGLKPNDIFILQATRIVTRKAIELAIDLVRALNEPDRREKLLNTRLYNGQKFSKDSNIVLVLAGYDKDDATGTYLQRLLDKAARENVKIKHIAPIVANTRQEHADKKLYSLWDCYASADLVTYPSVWEGWGNQLLEALRARLPVVLFEYPVFAADIKSSGLDVVSLGEKIVGMDETKLLKVPEETIQKAADDCVRLLTDRDHRESVTEKNFRICQKAYSLTRLQEQLADMLESLT
ncbi:MAG TPA: glycosyltransferase family 4 protein [Chloroflexi bacterium]|nr:glycosyltransferase family 4 protein [Anaerolineaceae bacterium]HHX09089.1 glycosyltransferase family 4 protein [Chloroflexota bacterium]